MPRFLPFYPKHPPLVETRGGTCPKGATAPPGGKSSPFGCLFGGLAAGDLPVLPSTTIPFRDSLLGIRVHNTGAKFTRGHQHPPLGGVLRFDIVSYIVAN